MANETAVGLANLALMLAAARKQGIYGRRSAREELADKRARQQLMIDQFNWSKQQAEAEAKRQAQADAERRATGFLNVLQNPDALVEMSRSGLLPGILGAAKGAFGEAGIPIDLGGLAQRGGLREQHTPGYVDLGNQAMNPAAVPQFLTDILPAPTPAASSYVPRMEQARTPQEALSVPAPSRIEMRNQSISPEVLQGLPPALRAALGGLVTPAGPVNVPLPDVVTERPVESQLQPSMRAQREQGKLDNATLIALARQLLMGEQANLAGVRAGDIGATQPGRVANLNAGVQQKQAGTGLTKARTATEGKRPALVTAQTAATKSIPGYRQGQLQLGEKRIETTKRGQDIGAATAAANRAAREGIAGASLQERIAARKQRAADVAAKARAAGAPSAERALFNKQVEIATRFKTNSITNQPEPAFPQKERENAVAGARSFGRKWRMDLTGIGLEDYSGGGVPTASAGVGAPAASPVPSGRRGGPPVLPPASLAPDIRPLYPPRQQPGAPAQQKTRKRPAQMSDAELRRRLAEKLLGAK